MLKRDRMGEIKEHYKSLTWYQKIGFCILWALSCLISYSPRFLRYGVLRPFITFIFRLVGYRKRVILRNLQRSFPEKSDKEIKRIMRAYYVTLAEAVVNTISLVGANPKRAGSALLCDETEQQIERTKGRDWIVMPAHYGCWEYYPLWCWKDDNCDFISVYHPMKSPIFEHYYRRIRNYGDNNFLVSMNDTVRYYVKRRGKGRNMVLGLISDQSPILRADTEWVEFLNQPTAFIDGGTRLAIRFGLPIYFVEMERIKADSYKMRYTEIYDGQEQVEPMVVVRRYAELLEAMIRRRPELWMWSHNRWRHTPEKQARRFEKKKEA